MKRDPALVRLSWDHHHGLVMARRIASEVPEATGEELSALYADLVTFWAAGLLPHFRAEGECMLARLVRHVSPGHASIQRLHADHLEMEALAATMRDTESVDDRREALLAFGRTLHDHIRWEERELFELVQENLDPEEMQRLGSDFETQLPDVDTAAAPPGGTWDHDSKEPGSGGPGSA